MYHKNYYIAYNAKCVCLKEGILNFNYITFKLCNATDAQIKRIDYRNTLKGRYIKENTQC